MAASRKLGRGRRAWRLQRWTRRLRPQTLNPAMTLTSFSPRCACGSCHRSRWSMLHISAGHAAKCTYLVLR